MAASAALPILINVGKVLATYGPLAVQFLVQIGVIHLPAGVTLPPLPTTPNAAVDPAHLAALRAIQAEIDLDALRRHAGELNGLYLAARAGNLAHSE
jgi:hypothetical protein